MTKEEKTNYEKPELLQDILQHWKFRFDRKAGIFGYRAKIWGWRQRRAKMVEGLSRAAS